MINALNNNLKFLLLTRTPSPEQMWETHDHIYPTPPLGQDMTQGQFFKRSLTGLNSEFSFS